MEIISVQNIYTNLIRYKFRFSETFFAQIEMLFIKYLVSLRDIIIYYQT